MLPTLTAVARTTLTAASESGASRAVRYAAAGACPRNESNGASEKFHTVLSDVVSTTVVGKVVHMDLGEVMDLCAHLVGSAPNVGEACMHVLRLRCVSVLSRECPACGGPLAAW